MIFIPPLETDIVAVSDSTLIGQIYLIVTVNENVHEPNFLSNR